MTLPLTREVTRTLEILFEEPQRNLLALRLESEAAQNIPLHEDSKPHDLDRIRLSILKLVALDGWDENAAFEEAKIDWRDLFMAAGFAHSPDEHENWFKEISGDDFSEPEAYKEARQVACSPRWAFWRK